MYRTVLSISISAAVITTAVIGIPFVMSSLFHQGSNVQAETKLPVSLLQHKKLPDAAQDLPIQLYLSKQQRVITIPLERYVLGVVAAEMPTSFHLEALKAQAVAARTNVIHSIVRGQKFTGNAEVTDDYRSFQAYLTDEDLQAKWGSQYQQNMQIVTEAVADTQTEILTYQSSPIDAKFFSTSNGHTEAGGAYFGKAEPYLQSVSCPWDFNAPHHTDVITVPLTSVLEAVGAGSLSTLSSGGSKNLLQIVSETASHHVDKLKIGAEVISGPEFRSKLIDHQIKLYSTDFSFSVENGNVTFTTHGYGHGVGMSQYGADGMGKAGKDYRKILTYFYQGTAIHSYEDVLNK